MKTSLPYFLYCIFLLSYPSHAFEQFQVSISQSGTGANSCSRILSANASQGSGNYSYLWSVVTPGISFPGPDNLQTVSLALNQTVDVMVTVTDNITSATVWTVTTVHRVLLGSFDLFIPNFITPNGDGYNDAWKVTDSGKGIAPINAYSYGVSIVNSSNVQVYSDTGTMTTGYVGWLGGDIQWNARYNGTGSIVPVGIYSYSLVLQNCSQSHVYNGAITVVY